MMRQPLHNLLHPTRRVLRRLIQWATRIHDSTLMRRHERTKSKPRYAASLLSLQHRRAARSDLTSARRDLCMVGHAGALTTTPCAPVRTIGYSLHGFARAAEAFELGTNSSDSNGSSAIRLKCSPVWFLSLT
jgi:hypothetical protein